MFRLEYGSIHYPIKTVVLNAISGSRILHCIVLYGEFLEWPKYKLQGPLGKQNELTKQLKTEKKLATRVKEMIN